MTARDTTDARLDQLGDALRAAAADDLAGAAGAQRAAAAGGAVSSARPRRRRRVTLAVVAAAVVAVPGVALAASALISGDDVERSIPAGTLALMGTDPDCTVVREGIEFDCVLARAPVGEIAPGDWIGTVEPTVGADRRVNGGCRSLNANGTRWRCWIGREAVRQQTIGAEFLGQEVSGPGVG